MEQYRINTTLRIIRNAYLCHFLVRYGQDIESLTVYMVNATDPYTTNKTQLWTMSGNRGDRWRGAEVHLNSPVDFQVS